VQGKPNVAYFVLNFCTHWKKQTTLRPCAYAGIPYQSLGECPSPDLRRLLRGPLSGLGLALHFWPGFLCTIDNS
jgi:hypothetical protein